MKDERSKANSVSLLSRLLRHDVPGKGETASPSGSSGAPSNGNRAWLRTNKYYAI